MSIYQSVVSGCHENSPEINTVRRYLSHITCYNLHVSLLRDLLGNGGGEGKGRTESDFSADLWCKVDGWIWRLYVCQYFFHREDWLKKNHRGIVKKIGTTNLNPEWGFESGTSTLYPARVFTIFNIAAILALDISSASDQNWLCLIRLCVCVVHQKNVSILKKKDMRWS